jgi:hypothetical protein
MKSLVIGMMAATFVLGMGFLSLLFILGRMLLPRDRTVNESVQVAVSL